MSAKLLNVFADENPDLHRQIGCMSGLFQMFDRRHLLAGRHLGGQVQHKKILPGNLRAESHMQLDLEKNLNRRVNENQRFSTESSRPSFSSSSGSSSFSSLDCNKSTLQEHLPFQRSTFQETFSKNSQKLQPSIDTSVDRCCTTPARALPQTGSPSLDFRDFVKDSIYRDTSSMSIKTTSTTNAKKNVIKHQDSPRPVPLSKSVDRSHVSGRNGKSKVSLDVDKSLGLLGTLKKSSSYFSEAKEPRSRRSSFEAREDLFPLSKESPRFSCDSNVKSGNKLKELPRLSLGSREDSIRSANFDLKCNLIVKDIERSHVDRRISRALALQQDFASDKQPHSLVAKLMGLEAMPNLSCPSPDHIGLTRSISCKDSSDDHRKCNCVSKSPRMRRESKQEWASSPKRCNMDSITPKKQNPNPQFAIETASWKQQEKDRSSRQKRGSECKETPVNQQHESVYREIDRKLEELEFLQSNKDFRALKQILDAIQAKRILEAKKTKKQQELATNSNAYNCQSSIGFESYDKSKSADRTNSRSVESPIVIMKPAKSMQKFGTPPATVIPLESLARLRKIRITAPADSKKALVGNRVVKDRTPKSSPGATVDGIHASAHKKLSNGIHENNLQRHRVRKLQGSSSPQPSPTENSGGSVKTSNSLSPRMQHKKLELKKKTRSPDPSDLTSPRRQTKQAAESVSPRGKLRAKPKLAQKNDGSLNEINCAAANLSHDSDGVSLCSDISLASQVDVEVTSTDKTVKPNPIFFHTGLTASRKGNVDSVASIIESKISLMNLREGGSSAKVELTIPEQPSPISVLDASFYKDDMPPLSTNETSCSPEVQESENFVEVPSEDTWKLLQADNPSIGMNNNKLRNINVQVRKLRQLSDDRATVKHVSKLCDSEDPDQRYISEILLASGLLFQDLSLYQPREGFNPDLFLVLEQRRTGYTKPQSICEATMKPKPDPKRLHRKLLFDTVNEILIQKLGGPDPRHGSRMLNGQILLQELCMEIKQLQDDGSQGNSSNDDEPDGLDLILSRDVMRQSKGWTTLGAEVPGLILDIERSIFKDLIDEVVRSESLVNLRVKSCRLQRQLFAK